MISRNHLAGFICLATWMASSGELHADPASLPGFLAGCWQGQSGQGETIDERYSTLTGGEIFGVVTTSKKNKVTFFEFIRIHADGDKLVYQPYPNGKMANVVFVLTEMETDKLTFSNPDHDFPQLISYRLTDRDTLLTRVVGSVKGRTVVNEYTTSRTACK